MRRIFEKLMYWQADDALIIVVFKQSGASGGATVGGINK